MAFKGYQFRASSVLALYNAIVAFMPLVGWINHINKFKAYTTLTATGNCANGNTLTLDGKVYTMKTALTPAEGEILLGATAADSLANIKLAINRTDPGTNDGVKYKVAAAHSSMSAENLTATTLLIQALTAGTAGNSLATTETLANMTLTGATLANGTDNQVFKSNSESGKEPYGYVYIVNNGTTISFYNYQYWDETLLPQGTGAYRLSPLANGSYDDRMLTAVNIGLTYEVYCGGDKDMVFIMPNISLTSLYVSPYYGCAVCFGHFNKRMQKPDYPEVTTNALTAGSNVTIQVADTSKIVTGSYIQILGKQASTFEGCDQLHVQSVTNSTDFVVDSVPRNYVAGAFIGSPASIYGHIPIGYAGGLSTSGKFMPCSYYTDAAKTVGAGYYAIQNLITVTGISGKTLKSYLNPIYCSFDIALGYETSFPNCGSIANVYDALIANTDLSIPVQYTATAGGNTTLTDAGKAWTPDALIGKLVVLTGGTGIGQCRKITDNDATSITVDRQWELNPDATTNYKICDTLYRCALGIAGYSNAVALKVTDTVIPS